MHALIHYTRCGSRPRASWAARARPSPSRRPASRGAGATTPCARWRHARRRWTSSANGGAERETQGSLLALQGVHAGDIRRLLAELQQFRLLNLSRRGRSTSTAELPAHRPRHRRHQDVDAQRSSTMRSGARCTPHGALGVSNECRSAACGCRGCHHERGRQDPTEVHKITVARGSPQGLRSRAALWPTGASAGAEELGPPRSWGVDPSHIWSAPPEPLSPSHACASCNEYGVTRPWCWRTA